MAADVDVCNLGLSSIGIGVEIASLDERSETARACNRVYTMARDKVLRSFPWAFAKRQQALGLVSQLGDAIHPTTEYKFAYRYPSDCLKIRKILSEIRTDARRTRISYEEMADAQGTLIVTDRENAVLEYTSTLGQQPGRWSADFVEALGYYVGYLVAPRLTKGDPFKIRNEVLGLFRGALLSAQANAANEIQPDEDPDSELILARY